ncbi:ribosome small subunit-dependent GTPase A [Bythopirellula polymerisocia]|uniref:Small ribosomal subunit biogenesis GTPase RsgA n=1 Tax=Bythopirellula polymerisocia TaxID=2528003 RepID=A0A5C6CPM9_9BACT|nr:ribosome small subunit-dependent GTPase A [Bythopirellula polymerisocia]TWU25985.1 putative ribosome biogenesis GTPase RsgA [Bythopirellula polymerisocia]
MGKKKQRKVRADLRKNRNVRTRSNDLTRDFASDEESVVDLASGQSVSGKGDLTRKRTVANAEIDEEGIISPAVDTLVCLDGRVLRVQGLVSMVQFADGTLRQCATRRLLKTLSTDQRHVVAAGDRVWVRPSGADEGIIERVEPRTGVLSRNSRGRQHVLVTNVDQLLIVTSAAQPRLKPNLLDRYLVTAERARIEPIICINKVDLVDRGDLQPLVGVYSQLGYRVLQISAAEGWGIPEFRSLLRGRSSVLTGQSGVGKSSLLNIIDPGLALRVQQVSAETEKGKHTTTTSELIPLSMGGFVIDTPGIRQFRLWDVVPEELAGFFRDLRPYVSHCRYPDCTHTHEEPCAVKDAVAEGAIDVRRYESYLQIHAGDEI